MIILVTVIHEKAMDAETGGQLLVDYFSKFGIISTQEEVTTFALNLGIPDYRVRSETTDLHGNVPEMIRKFLFGFKCCDESLAKLENAVEKCDALGIYLDFLAGIQRGNLLHVQETYMAYKKGIYHIATSLNLRKLDVDFLDRSNLVQSTCMDKQTTVYHVLIKQLKHDGLDLFPINLMSFFTELEKLYDLKQIVEKYPSVAVLVYIDLENTNL